MSYTVTCLNAWQLFGSLGHFWLWICHFTFGWRARTPQRWQWSFNVSNATWNCIRLQRNFWISTDSSALDGKEVLLLLRLVFVSPTAAAVLFSSFFQSHYAISLRQTHSFCCCCWTLRLNDSSPLPDHEWWSPVPRIPAAEAAAKEFAAAVAMQWVSIRLRWILPHGWPNNPLNERLSSNEIAAAALFFIICSDSDHSWLDKFWTWSYNVETLTFSANLD